ncbi:MAG: 5'-deoxynucleotidase [Clostridia bacterium]|nr:5'-deoxynucleotidase [Clostridia bacterium]
MSSSFYAMISRMKYISRWALMRNTENESIAQHSLDTAVIAHALAVLRNKRFGGSVSAEKVAMLAIFHDVPEILTGDLPTPVKYYNPEIRDAYKKVEQEAGQRLLSMLPDDLCDEYRPLLFQDASDSQEHQLVKAADKISALIKCIEEEKAGNSEFASAKKATLASIEKLNIPEANEFIKEFLPAYQLTLDEQGEL